MSKRYVVHTNIDENCAIILLIHDVILKDLVVQGLWFSVCTRHCVEWYLNTTKQQIKKQSEYTRLNISQQRICDKYD